MNNLDIARTILQQLGGRRFLAMTGSRNLAAWSQGLMFTLPRMCKDGSNKVVITLDASDTYTLNTYRIRQHKCSPCSQVDHLYAENLQAAFTRITGLDTHL